MAGGVLIDVRTNADALLRRIGELRNDQVPFVTAVAMTRTAQDVKAAEVAKMAEVFDRPTRFTLNSLMVRAATKQSLRATVEFKEGFGSVPAWRYLGPQVEGGARVHKTFERRLIAAGLMLAGEFAVPGLGAQLDQSGNVRGSTITRILSDLGAQGDKWQNAGAQSRRRAKRRNRGQYLVLRGEGGARPGIYLRRGVREIVPVFVFVRTPTYQKRFPFHATAQAVIQRNFAYHMRAAWSQYAKPAQSLPLRIAA